MNAIRTPAISVIGGATCTAEQETDAEEVGRLLATRGIALVCGGRGGVMQAACRGAHRAGGMTIGILPGTRGEEGNPYLSIAISTGLGHVRNALVIQAGQAVIAIGGEYGTLSEIAIALKMGRKVVGLRTWQAMNHSGEAADIIAVETPLEAVRVATSFLPQDVEGG